MKWIFPVQIIIRVLILVLLLFIVWTLWSYSVHHLYKSSVKINVEKCIEFSKFNHLRIGAIIENNLIILIVLL